MSNTMHLTGFVAKDSIKKNHRDSTGDILEFRVREKCWNKKRGNYVTYWRVRAFGNTATNASKFIADGAYVVVTGRLSVEKMTVQDRDTKLDKEIVVIEITASGIEVPKLGSSENEPQKSVRDEDPHLVPPPDDNDLPF